MDVAGGLPGLEIVGLADTSVREARHRVRSALHNSGHGLPSRRITVNLSPASLHKEGSQMDLGIAAGILAASAQVPQGDRLSGYCFLGELALDGRIKPVKGVLAMVLAAVEAGMAGAVIPEENQGEVSFLSGVDIRTAGSLADLASFLRGRGELAAVHAGQVTPGPKRALAVDFAEIRGQKAAKRALEVACSGGHNVLMSGPPGAGKSMLAGAVPGVLPELTVEESLVVTRIHSVAGILPEGEGLLRDRPFRAPHHTVTASALVGGGTNPRPGEVTLAHRGVLFLDELPEFAPSVLNALRQPLEDGTVLVTRSRGTHRFPCRFHLIAAMNPCKCGWLGDDIRHCTCTEYERKQYVGRISGPFLDRMDMHLEIGRVAAQELEGQADEASAAVRARVCEARARQAARLAGTGLSCNAEMGPAQVTAVVSLSTPARKLVLDAFRRLGLSARGYYRVLKVASTVADLAGSPRVEEEHVAEALSYRQRLAGEG